MNIGRFLLASVIWENKFEPCLGENISAAIVICFVTKDQIQDSCFTKIKLYHMLHIFYKYFNGF